MYLTKVKQYIMWQVLVLMQKAESILCIRELAALLQREHCADVL